jgi:hypothetical protein
MSMTTSIALQEWLDLKTRAETAEAEVVRLRSSLVVCRIRCERAEKQLAQEQRRRDREARR